MPQPFARSLRSLELEPRWLRALAAVLWLGLGTAWCVWFFAARLHVAATLEQARLEAARVSHRVQAPVEGMVVHQFGRLGDTVEAGQLLLELDAAEQLQQQARQAAQLRALGAEQAARERQIAALAARLESERQASSIRIAEASALEQQALGQARLGAEARERKELLGNAGAIPQLDVLQARALEEQQRTQAVALGVGTERARADSHVSAAERVELLAGLERERAVIEGRRATLAAELLGIEAEIERRQIRAPVTGRLGDVVPLTEGMRVQAGQTFVTIIPDGGLRIVAQLPESELLGRIRPGQAAEMRLDAFPWTAYGTLQATVSRVARETRDGGVRVELELVGPAPLGVRLEHGLPGRVRIEVEESTPAQLLLRAAGHLLRAQQVPG